MSYETYDIFVIAGEKSGDLHGEKILQALFAHNPHLKIAGVGGPRMRAQGLSCTLPMEEFQVMGFVDVFLALPKLMRHFYTLSDQILRANPKLLLTIDYPGLNLRLARHLKKKGFTGKICHFICPSVWAWGKKRIPLMARYLDELLTILPFEKTLFSHTPLPVHYVGHPLIARLSEKTPCTPPKDKIISLFPGSRKKEIERNLPLFLDACQELHKAHPSFHFALSLSEERFRPLILEILNKKRWQSPIDLTPPEKTEELMQSTYLAIAKSGTVTLELALHRVPTVVTYAISTLDLIIARDLLRIRLPYYCIVNIIANKEIFAELFGPHFTAENLLNKVNTLLASREKCQEACTELLQLLGNKNSAKEVAQKVLLHV